MAFVPWEKYGICKFYASPGVDCKNGVSCRWGHPAPEVMTRIWGFHNTSKAPTSDGEERFEDGPRDVFDEHRSPNSRDLAGNHGSSRTVASSATSRSMRTSNRGHRVVAARLAEFPKRARVCRRHGCILNIRHRRERLPWTVIDRHGPLSGMPILVRYPWDHWARHRPSIPPCPQTTSSMARPFIASCGAIPCAYDVVAWATSRGIVAASRFLGRNKTISSSS